MVKEKKLGFTLIELLVVIAIIAILTAVAVSQFSSAKTKARDTQRKTDAESVAKAADMYFADYGKFPHYDMVPWGGEIVDNDGYVYMKVVPRESFLDTNYCYLMNSELTEYVIFARMEGVGSTTGSYTVTDANVGCDRSTGVYNFAKPSANTTVIDFCGATGSGCEVE